MQIKRDDVGVIQMQVLFWQITQIVHRTHAQKNCCHFFYFKTNKQIESVFIIHQVERKRSST